MTTNLICFFMLLLTTSTSLYGQIITKKNGDEYNNRPVKISCQMVPIELIHAAERSPAQEAEFSSKSPPQLLNRHAANKIWSGYMAATNIKNPKKHSVTSVIGSWTVPSITPSDTNTFSSICVGMDGYRGHTFEQIGTESDWNAATWKQTNYAWFQVHPKKLMVISGFPVNNGDIITGMVKYKGGGRFRLLLMNFTRNSYTVLSNHHTRNHRAHRHYAEWIVKASTSAHSILPLANFGLVDFTKCRATIDGKTRWIRNHKWQHRRVIMKTASGITKARPSELKAHGTGFTIAWHHE